MSTVFFCLSHDFSIDLLPWACYIMTKATKGGDAMIDLKKLEDAQVVADSLSGLPKEALIYIAGYAEGWRDKPKRKRKEKPTNTENQESV